ncbi:MAG: hypothetical protein JHD15_26335 [Phenylobacterium sp.]|uniref:hypothetical protein n=1 Tax=Phenylobacterium sp. TaxID=1871053 RepID=UPI001A253023|nr:hypothetical protein [Phenylobacterium sp.]MBJ7413847.1 hypothetical protein [Phenylobacterium sp.]
MSIKRPTIPERLFPTSRGLDDPGLLNALARTRDIVMRKIGAVVALFAVAVCAWTFPEVVDEVVESETASLDRQILVALRSGGDGNEPLGPRWREIAAADANTLGSASVLVLVVAFVAGLVSMLRRREAFLVVVAASGGTGLSSTLKALFDRERPEVALRAVEVVNPNFPRATLCSQLWCS